MRTMYPLHGGVKPTRPREDHMPRHCIDHPLVRGRYRGSGGGQLGFATSSPKLEIKYSYLEGIDLSHDDDMNNERTQ